MTIKNYHLTPLARQHLRTIRASSRAEFGKAMTDEYFQELHEGLQYAALHQGSLPKRAEMTGNTGLFLHHIGSHYVAFKPIADDEIIVGSVLHESMNIPERLRELRGMTQREITVIATLIAQADKNE